MQTVPQNAQAVHVPVNKRRASIFARLRAQQRINESSDVCRRARAGWFSGRHRLRRECRGLLLPAIGPVAMPPFVPARKAVERRPTCRGCRWQATPFHTRPTRLSLATYSRLRPTKRRCGTRTIQNTAAHLLNAVRRPFFDHLGRLKATSPPVESNACFDCGCSNASGGEFATAVRQSLWCETYHYDLR